MCIWRLASFTIVMRAGDSGASLMLESTAVKKKKNRNRGVFVLIIPALGNQWQEDPWGSMTSQPSVFRDPRFKWETLSQKNKGDYGWEQPPRTLACIHRKRETQTWTHTSTHSHKHIGTYKLAHAQIKVFIITRNTYYKIWWGLNLEFQSINRFQYTVLSDEWQTSVLKFYLPTPSEGGGAICTLMMVHCEIHQWAFYCLRHYIYGKDLMWLWLSKVGISFPSWPERYWYQQWTPGWSWCLILMIPELGMQN